MDKKRARKSSTVVNLSDRLMQELQSDEYNDPNRRKKEVAKIKASLEKAEVTSDQQGKQVGKQVGTKVGVPTKIPTNVPTKMPTNVPSSAPTTIPSYHEPVPLTEKQAVLYICIKKLEGKPTSLAKIHYATRLSLNTLKKCLNKLKNEGLIHYNGFTKIGKLSGFTATITDKKMYICDTTDHLIKSVMQMDFRLLLLTEYLPEYLPLYLADDGSSSSLLKPTTLSFNNSINGEIEKILTEPEMSYWQDKGLTSKQIKSWMDEFKSPLTEIVQSLCHCRFDLVDNGLEESKPIRNVWHWFYKRLDKTGYYAAPTGYTSYEEQALEREKAIVEKKQRQRDELEQLHNKKIKLQRDVAFQEMLANTDSEMYKECYANLEEYEKKKIGTKTFDILMRNVFDQLYDIGVHRE
ncbi:MAG: hypothetical protein GY861_23240 [bacterium]|nr:hypothetical protein [bacterium]